MEWPGRRDRRRLQQLLVAIAAIALPLAILLHYSLPVTGLLGEPLIVENIVLQTTPYTCAPASIATLARLIGTAPNLSEREAVILTGTDRFGTSTLAEISALKRLGLAPRYRRGLTVAELAAAKQPALLHVKEPVGGIKIGHTVVLLETNSQKQTFIIGNPLYGRLERTFDSMEGYWTGEAVFASGGD
jgi:predicted double-glycine peptidase